VAAPVATSFATRSTALDPLPDPDPDIKTISLPQVDGSRQNHTIQARRLAMRRGPSRSEVLRSLTERGLAEQSLLAIRDGALGLWAALDEIFPTTRHQRCWNHRKLNVPDKLPKHCTPRSAPSCGHSPRRPLDKSASAGA